MNILDFYRVERVSLLSRENSHEFQHTLRIHLHPSSKRPSSANGSERQVRACSTPPWTRPFATSIYIDAGGNHRSARTRLHWRLMHTSRVLGLRQQICGIARIWLTKVEVWTVFPVKLVYPHPVSGENPKDRTYKHPSLPYASATTLAKSVAGNSTKYITSFRAMQ